MIDFSSDNFLQNNSGFQSPSDLLNQIQQELFNETNSCLNQAKQALFFNSKSQAVEAIADQLKTKKCLILFDELCDPNLIQVFKNFEIEICAFPHNDPIILEEKMLEIRNKFEEVFVFTESVFHIDGDSPNMSEIVDFKSKYQIKIVIDESFAIGVFGQLGQGLLIEQNFFQETDLILYADSNQNSTLLVDNLGLNSFEEHDAISSKNQLDDEVFKSIEKLQQNILYFNQQKKLLGLNPVFVRSKSAIHSMVLPNENQVINAKNLLSQNQIKAQIIQFPLVPKNQSRIRFSLNSNHTTSEIDHLFQVISQIVYS